MQANPLPAAELYNRFQETPLDPLFTRDRYPVRVYYSLLRFSIYHELHTQGYSPLVNWLLKQQEVDEITALAMRDAVLAVHYNRDLPPIDKTYVNQTQRFRPMTPLVTWDAMNSRYLSSGRFFYYSAEELSEVRELASAVYNRFAAKAAKTQAEAPKSEEPKPEAKPEAVKPQEEVKPESGKSGEGGIFGWAKEKLEAAAVREQTEQIRAQVRKDAEKEAEQIRSAALEEAARIRQEAEQYRAAETQKAQQIRAAAMDEAARIRQEAERQAKEKQEAAAEEEVQKLVQQKLGAYMKAQRTAWEQEQAAAARDRGDIGGTAARLKQDICDVTNARGSELNRSLDEAIARMESAKAALMTDLQKWRSSLYKAEYGPLVNFYVSLNNLAARFEREALGAVLQPLSAEEELSKLQSHSTSLAKLRSNLLRSMDALGIAPFTPQPGELFDSYYHTTENEDEDDDYMDQPILRCVSPGLMRTVNAQESVVLLRATVEAQRN